MKKNFMFFILLICIICNNVNASSNKLYFSEKDGRLYYDTDLLENTFMYHTDMIPGASYIDELLIENGTNTEYNLYLKVKDSEDNNTLLDQIFMEVTLDNNIVYSGTARGKDYDDDQKLTDAIFIGKYKAKQQGKLVVKTSLDKNYNNPNGEEAKISWEFYGDYEPIMPNTGDNVNVFLVTAICSILCIMGLIIVKNKLE